MNSNSRQVGGTHYKTAYEHWDFSAHLKLGGFEHTITKYITRHRSKDGRRDIEKAIHNTEKLRELALHSGFQPMHAWLNTTMMADYAHANRLTPHEAAVIRTVCTWGSVADLWYAVQLMQQILIEYDAGSPRVTGVDVPLETGDPVVFVADPPTPCGFDTIERVMAAPVVPNDPTTSAVVQAVDEPGPGYVDQDR